MADSSSLLPHAASGQQRVLQRRRWRRISRIATLLFFAIVVGAMVMYARSIKWEPVLAALKTYKVTTLAGAALVAALSCTLYASFDLLTGAHSRHRLRAPWMVAVAFSSFTFNLNLGPWIGSFGLRLRLYTKLGLTPAQVLRVLAFTTVTNWQGYFALAGVVFLVFPPLGIPESWPIGIGAVRVAGAVLLSIALTYIGLCAFSPRRVWTIRHFSLRLPSLRMAVWQTVVASVNWILIALVPYILLRGEVPIDMALVSLLLACAFGALAHIPGGLGVIDGTLLTLLGWQMPTHELLAALLVYRATYYLWPFTLGLVTFGTLETLLRRRRSAAAEA